MTDTTTSTTPAGCIGPDHHPGMVRLPVAPQVNHRIRFTPVTEKKAPSIYPEDAVGRVTDLLAHGSSVDTVLLYGPGDPLASIEPVLETISQLRAELGNINIVIRTLGINGLKHADKLLKAGINEVELLLDGVEPEVLEKIYAWVRPGFKTLKLADSIAILMEEQSKAIQAFSDAGLHVRLISTCYPTVNDKHFNILCKKAAEWGADEIVIHPYTAAPGADITLEDTSSSMLDSAVADAAGILPATKGRPIAVKPLEADETASALPKPTKERPNVAVVSTNGMDVDLHLGQAPQMLIYGPREDGLACLLECRQTPPPGAGKDRWDKLAGTIPDCFALLTASAGDRPKKILRQHNIQVVMTSDNIEGTVDVLYGGGKKGKGCKPQSAAQ